MAKESARKLNRLFWTKQSGLTSIFILLCINNFIVVPFLANAQTITILMRIVWFILLFTGITTLAETNNQKRIFSLIPLALILVSTLDYIISSRILTYAILLIELSVFFLLIWLVLVKVFERGRITVHKVIGSIAVYILLGDVWAQIFEFLFLNVPDSLQIPDVHLLNGVHNSVFLYFSFTTLTTTGFGEILPVNAIARTLVIIEQLIGVLYPVVLIGSLVGSVSIMPGKES